MKKTSSETAPGKKAKRQKHNAQQADNSCIISPGPKLQPYSRKIDLTSKRHYTIKKAPDAHLDYNNRLTIQTAWNRYINAGARIPLSAFAQMHGLSFETWRREYYRGATGATVKVNGRWQYATYSADKAQADIDRGKADMGTPMKLTAPVASQLRILVCEKKLSPYDARETLREKFPAAYVPCLRTIYNHIDAGDIGIARGETPYHPGNKRRRKIV